MNLRGRTLFSLLLAACLLALAAPATFAAKGLEIAAQDDEQFLSDHGEIRAAAFAHARALGVSSLRANVSWSRVVDQPTSRTAPATPLYDFTRFDRLITEAALHGIRVQLTLAGPAPAWATGDHKVGTDRVSPALYAAFTAAVARHFSGRVRAVSIWNEPNWHGLLKPERLCGKVTKTKKVKVKVKGKNKKVVKRKKVKRKVCVKTSARRYRALYRAAYTSIKRAAPTMPVWIGETNPYVNRRKQSTAPLAWLRQLICVDGVVKGCKGTLRADGYAHHPYAFDRAPNKKRNGVRRDHAREHRQALQDPQQAEEAHPRRAQLALPDRVRLLLHGPERADREEARGVDAAGVRARAQGAQRAAAPLLPAGRPGHDEDVPNRPHLAAGSQAPGL